MQKRFSWPEKFCFGVFDHMVCLEGGQIGGQSGQKWTFFIKKIQKNLKKIRKNQKYIHGLHFGSFDPK